MNKEIFKDCKGYEGKYQVSDQGRVWSVAKQQYLKGSTDKDGYIQVYLTAKNGKSKKEFVHRLVAIAFLPNPEDKTDNSISNLCWTTEKENSNHGTRNERISKANSIPVYCVELDKVFYGAREAAKELGISHSGIIRCCKGEYKSSHGYHFRYAEGGGANASD